MSAHRHETSSIYRFTLDTIRDGRHVGVLLILQKVIERKPASTGHGAPGVCPAKGTVQLDPTHRERAEIHQGNGMDS
jgi:hypothetical protein